jgi:hypothetical protein
MNQRPVLAFDYFDFAIGEESLRGSWLDYEVVCTILEIAINNSESW